MSPPEQPQKRGVVARIWAFAPFQVWLTAAAMLGGIIGLGAFTFAFGEGTAYLSNDPAACVNCHVMRDQFDGWNHGSHKAVATCNDCHTPHDSVIAKYAVKGINGLRHSVAFTLGGFHEPIQITNLNRNVAQDSCIYCHEALTADMSHLASNEPTDCLFCHARVGHAK